MEIATVRQRVLATLDRAKRAAAERRERADEAGRDYAAFLDRVAVPLFRQVANALRASGYLFNVFTPSGSVRLMSDRSADDYIELLLDTTGEAPCVMCRTSRARGRRVIDSEQPLDPSRPIRDLTEDDVLSVLLNELEPFVEK